MKVLEKINVLEKITLNKPKFQILILNCKFNNNSFKGKILGRNLSEWVAFACGQNSFKIFDYDKKVNPLEFVKDKICSCSGYFNSANSFMLVLSIFEWCVIRPLFSGKYK